MKKITLLLLALSFIISSFAQSPQAFKYQAAARDASGNPLNNQLISLRISILQGSATGTSVYSETHQPTTNAFGLANIEIGSGSAVSGTFASIDWSSGPYFLKVELDATGGTTYELMGTSQLLSVPYALYSGSTANPDDNDWTISGDDLYSTVAGNVGIGTSTPVSKLEVAGRIGVSGTGGSVLIGKDAGLSDDFTDNNNVYVGESAGKSSTSGYDNTALGYAALSDNTEGTGNIAIGSLALENNSSGENNIVIGNSALQYNISGSNNTVLGIGAGNAGYWGQSMSGCIFIGSYAGKNENSDNTLYIENSNSNSPLIYGEFDNDILVVNGKLGVGASSPTATLEVAGHIAVINTGSSVFLGQGAGLNDDFSTNHNVFIGQNAGMENTSGGNNTGVGALSLRKNISGNWNTAVGQSSLFSNTIGDGNTALGYSSLASNTEGTHNSALGSNALSDNTTGHNNTALGYLALMNNTTGSDNTVLGENSLNSNISGEGNVVIGKLGLSGNVIGNNNTVIGTNAGAGSTSVNGSVYIGYNAGLYETDDDKLYIENSYAAAPLIYGDFSSNILAVNGKLGIGTHTPSVKLHVTGGTDATISSGGSIVAGLTTGENIAMDENEIMARNNGAQSSLHLQRSGGPLSIHWELPEINEFIINSEGRTGIGENAPSAKLHINTSAGEDGVRVQINGQTKLKIASNGGIVNYNEIPTFALQLQQSTTDLLGRGKAYSWEIYSDNRLKSNQRIIEYGLEEILQLQPKSYDHHSSSTSEEGDFVMVTDQKIPTVGFIAQEVQKIIPEAVSEPQDDSKVLWSMDYNKLIPVLTKAIQEQQGMIKEQNGIIESLLSRIEALESK